MSSQKLWKKKAYEKALIDIIEIEDMGYRVERLTDYHWRINRRIDVWPSAKRYYVYGSYQSKNYEQLKDIIKHL